MSKGLEIIKKWKAQIHWNKDFGWNNELDIIEQEFKALEIIKNKILFIEGFQLCVRDDIELNEEECQIIEEVFKENEDEA